MKPLYEDVESLTTVVSCSDVAHKSVISVNKREEPDERQWDPSRSYGLLLIHTHSCSAAYVCADMCGHVMLGPSAQQVVFLWGMKSTPNSHEGSIFTAGQLQQIHQHYFKTSRRRNQ